MLKDGTLAKPLSFDEVGTCLGEPSRNLDGLCRSGKINVNSFRKPCSLGSLAELTDDQRRAANWGWGNLSGGASSGSLREVLAAKVAGAQWTVDVPAGDIDHSPCRALDFDGYRHGASLPFKVLLNSSSIKMGQNLSFTMDHLDELTRNIGKWGMMEGIPQDRAGLGVYIGNGSHVPSSQFYICLLAGANQLYTISSLEEKALMIPSSFFEKIGAYEGEWYLIPFLLIDSSSIPMADMDKSVLCTSSSPAGAVMFHQLRVPFTISGSAGPDVVSMDDVTIDLQNVSFTYDSEGYILQDVEYSIAFNQDRVQKVSGRLKVSIGMLGSEEYAYGPRHSWAAPGGYNDAFPDVIVKQEAGQIFMELDIVGTGALGCISGTMKIGTISDF